MASKRVLGFAALTIVVGSLLAGAILPTTQPGDATANTDPKWSYGADWDAVRQTSMTYACVVSPDYARLPPPDGLQPLQLCLTGGASRRAQAEVSFLKRGSFACRAGCRVTVSFDGAGPVTYRAVPNSNGSAAVINISDGQGLFERACRASQAVIEVELVGGGRQQFRLNTEGLMWEPKQGHGPDAYPHDCRKFV